MTIYVIDAGLCASHIDDSKTITVAAPHGKDVSLLNGCDSDDINMHRTRTFSSSVVQMRVHDNGTPTKQELKAANDSKACAPLSALWTLSKPDALYIAIGVVGAVAAAAVMPVQGIVLAYIQVCVLHHLYILYICKLGESALPHIATPVACCYNAMKPYRMHSLSETLQKCAELVIRGCLVL
jgi:hypothetical protein